MAVARGGYHGLYIELKRHGETVYLRSGNLSRTKRIRAQAAVLQSLRDQGYKAEFAVGFW